MEKINRQKDIYVTEILLNAYDYDVDQEEFRFTLNISDLFRQLVDVKSDLVRYRAFTITVKLGEKEDREELLIHWPFNLNCEQFCIMRDMNMPYPVLEAMVNSLNKYQHHDYRSLLMIRKAIHELIEDKRGDSELIDELANKIFGYSTISEVELCLLTELLYSLRVLQRTSEYQGLIKKFISWSRDHEGACESSDSSHRALFKLIEKYYVEDDEVYKAYIKVIIEMIMDAYTETVYINAFVDDILESRIIRSNVEYLLDVFDHMIFYCAYRYEFDAIFSIKDYLEKVRNDRNPESITKVLTYFRMRREEFKLLNDRLLGNSDGRLDLYYRTIIEDYQQYVWSCERGVGE